MSAIIAFAGSNSSTSINHQLVTYAASLLNEAQVITLTDYDIPIYDADYEREQGIPEEAQRLADTLKPAKALIISVAEHNGGLAAFFKSQLDWLSRHQRDFLKDKKVVILGTSPGASGAQSAISTLEKMLPFFSAEVIATCAIGQFNEVFQQGKLIDSQADARLKEALAQL
ncbi:NAD(P)H-dependent oxidoreductase [Suttonella sp. R2A3]|uniref:NADPH-dependent FMN reductase n=1 Tax=Suttonella sp. R2A3 TaxID=2908648 RepID=UPI001F2E3E75|nr:NADPH-dependent FMN reductase [Suttonella sp. R2A3]UJF24168.1 NAD(P)H-dependent oxidoreductase [Suttonella sp. R2A3]